MKRKASLFANSIIAFVESPKESTKPVLKLTNKLGKIKGYKIQNFVVYLFNNEQSINLIKVSLMI
jgi:hypothetical protein